MNTVVAIAQGNFNLLLDSLADGHSCDCGQTAVMGELEVWCVHVLGMNVTKIGVYASTKAP